MGKLPRAASESKLSSLQALSNVNVAWLDGPFVFPTYIFLILAFRAALGYLFVATEPSTLWSATHILHGLITFWAFHWQRGSPFWEDQGEFIDKTMWEQIDNGVPWTPKKKILIIVPIVLFLVSAYTSDYQLVPLAVNGGVLSVLLVSKLPEMDGIRLFGINKAPVVEGEDD